MFVKMTSIYRAVLLIANFTILYCIFGDNYRGRGFYDGTDTKLVRQRFVRQQGGYVLNLKYDGQQSSAEHAIVLQQCWLTALNLSSVHIVEPFLRQTIYQGYPPMPSTKSPSDPLCFSDVHDLTHYNDVSYTRGFAELANWQDFLDRSTKRIIFVNLQSSHFPETHYSIQCSNDSSSNCCSLKPLPDGMNHLLERGFCIVRVLNVHGPGYGLGDPGIREKLYGEWDPNDVTVVFSHWMQANSAQHFPQCYRVFRTSVMTELQAPSKTLLEESQAYKERFLSEQGNRTLSVMIRVERVIEQSTEGGHAAIARQNKSTRRAYLDKCFATLFETVNQMSHKTDLFVMTDVGKFSSNSWNRILSELNYSRSEARHVFDTTRKAVEKMVNRTFNDWENSFVELTSNSQHWRSPAYIAALQRTIAVNSDCLVLFGGGNFQEVALSAYLKNHQTKSTQCVHIICASQSLQRNLLDIMS